MADFISGQDLVARGAEGTGAAVVLDNRPTIQSLARLGGRMDNLYKTQEMLKLKLAAAKAEQAKPPKQPNINPYVTGGILGENLGAIGNQFQKALSAIDNAEYNQKLASNDIVGANQKVADSATSLSTIQSAVTNNDKVIQAYVKDNEKYYQLGGDKPMEIASQFPFLDPQELAKIQDPAKQKEYVVGQYNKFIQTDPNRILRNATLYDPRTYNYGGIFSVIDDNLKTRTIDINQASGTGYKDVVSELFIIKPGKAPELNYNKALSAVNQLPKAREQVEVLQTLAVNKAKETDIYKKLTEDEKKHAEDFIKEKTAKRYADKVFAIGLPLDQKRDFEATRIKAESEAAGRASGENEPEIATGPQRFNRKTELLRYDPATKTRVKQAADVTVVASGETFVMKKPVVMDANQVFLPMGRFNAEDKASLNAREYKNADNTVNNMYVGDKSFTLNNAKRVTGMPVFVMAVNDVNDKNIVYQPGDWVPEHMINAKKIRNGKEVPYMEKGNYIEVDGYVGSPEVSVKKGVDLSGNPVFEKSATTQNFYPDKNSSDLVINAIRNGMKNAKKTIFETKVTNTSTSTTAPANQPAPAAAAKTIFQKAAEEKKTKKKVFWNNEKAKETGAIK